MRLSLLSLLALALSVVQALDVPIDHTDPTYTPNAPPAASSLSACSSSSMSLGWSKGLFHWTTVPSGQTNCLFLSFQWSPAVVTSANREYVQLYLGNTLGTLTAVERSFSPDPTFSAFPSSNAQNYNTLTRLNTDGINSYLHVFYYNGNGVDLYSFFLLKVMSQLLGTGPLSFSFGAPVNTQVEVPQFSLFLELASADTELIDPAQKIQLSLPSCGLTTTVSYLSTGASITAPTDLVTDVISIPPLSGLQVDLAGVDCINITNAQLVSLSSLSSTRSQALSTADRIDIFKLPLAQSSLDHRITISGCTELTAVFGRNDSTFPLLTSTGAGYTKVVQTGSSITYLDSSMLGSVSLIVDTFDSATPDYGCTGTVVVDAKLDTTSLYTQGCTATPTDVFGDDYTTCTMAMCGVDPACSSDCGSDCAWNAFTVCASSFVPAITGVSVSIDSSSNVATLTITGTQFSCDPVIMINNTAATVSSCSATEVVVDDPTAVTVAGNRSLSVTFALAPCTELTQDVAYEPVVTSITPSNGPTSGSTLVTIAGQYFDSASVKIGGLACSVSTQTSTSIECNTPAGTGVDLDVEVTVGGAVGTLTGAFSYDAPTVTTNLPTLVTAGGTVTLSGTNFGANSSKVTVMSANTQSAATQTNFTVVSVSHTSIQITYPAGTGKSWQWTINVDGQTVMTSVTDYAAPTITGLTTLDTVGGSISITGTGFGPATPAITAEARLLRDTVTIMGVSLTSRVSDTVVVVSYPAGTGSGLTLEITIDGQTTTGNAKYEAPTVNALTLANTAGGSGLTISGRYFGTVSSVVSVSLTRDTTSIDATVTAVTDSSITITYSAGTGTGYSLVVTVDGQNSSAATAAYAAPTITAVSLADSVLTVTGTNFGSLDNETPLSMALLVDGEPITAAAFTLNSQTDTECQFDITSAGGSGVAVQLTIDGQTVNSSATVDFPAPTITAVGELATLGGNLTINGTYFTDNQALVTVAVTRAGSALDTSILSLSDSAIVLSVPAGVGANLTVSVQVVNQVAESTTRYQPPMIAEFTVLNVNLLRSTAQLNISGSGFGTDKDQVTCSLTTIGIDATIVDVSDFRITAEFAVESFTFGDDSDTLVVSVGGQEAQSSIYIQYSSSSLLSIQLSLLVTALFAIVM